MKNNFIKIGLVVMITGVLVASLVLAFNSDKKDDTSSSKNSEKLQVVASFYPIYEATEIIGGDKINLLNANSAGADPHDFEPNTQDTARIIDADLFIFQGRGFDTWAQDLATQKPREKNLEISTFFDLKDTKEGSHGHEDEKHADEDKKQFETDYDPHIWLMPGTYSGYVGIIAERLGQLDPENKDFYLKNAENYQKDLLTLSSDFSQTLSSCKSTKLIVTHNAFGYWEGGNGFGLETEGIGGAEPGLEPSAQKVAEVITEIQEENIKAVFYEDEGDYKLAKNIADQTGVKTLVLSTLETRTEEQENQNLTYIDIMRNNLASLREGLECS